MDATVEKTGTEGKTWGGGNRPMKAHYGKLMMWFFIASDALTFTGFLASYGFSRFKFLDSWPIADEVFNHFPFLHGKDAPMYYVAFMTFVLIFSSVTMVMAVEAGRQMNRKKVINYMLLTIVGGLIFIGSQVWEWSNFISGTHGAIETEGGRIVQVFNQEGDRVSLKDFAKTLPKDRVNHTAQDGVWFMDEGSSTTFNLQEVKAGFAANNDLVLRLASEDDAGNKIFLSRGESLALLDNQATGVVEGANLTHNEYGHPLFADFFFFITGFHGFHVSIGIMLNIVVFFNVVLGTYEKRGHYRMVEKVGLYWHFVDLVWVFVFTFFYLV